ADAEDVVAGAADQVAHLAEGGGADGAAVGAGNAECRAAIRTVDRASRTVTDERLDAGERAGESRERRVLQVDGHCAGLGAQVHRIPAAEAVDVARQRARVLERESVHAGRACEIADLREATGHAGRRAAVSSRHVVGSAACEGIASRTTDNRARERASGKNEAVIAGAAGKVGDLGKDGPARGAAIGARDAESLS